MVTIILFLILFVYIIYLHIKINKNNIEKMSDTVDASLTESINNLGRITKEILDNNDKLTIDINDVEFNGNVKINGNLVVDNDSTFNSHVEFNKETNFNSEINATSIDTSSYVNIDGKLKVNDELEVKEHGIIGNAYIGPSQTDSNNAVFSHKEKTGKNEYTLSASNTGATILNTSADEPIHIRNKGDVKNSMIKLAAIRPGIETSKDSKTGWLTDTKNYVTILDKGDISLLRIKICDSNNNCHIYGRVGQHDSGSPTDQLQHIWP